MYIEQLFNESLKLPGMTFSEDECSRTLHYHSPAGQGRGQTAFFPLFPGVTLAFTAARANAWPMPELKADPPPRLLIFSYCAEGRYKILLERGQTVYINSGEISITRRLSDKQYTYVKGVYEGVELLVDLDGLDTRNSYLLKDFGIDFSYLAEVYCPGDHPYTSPCLSEWKTLMQKLWGLSAGRSPHTLYQMRIYIMAALSLLMQGMNTPGSRQGSFLTEGQILIAHRTEALICRDLSRHYTISELASRFSISESSLKNYFRSVYGKSISNYLHDARMESSTTLLKDTTLSVAEIATQVGYLRQSKFSEAFKKQFGVTPLEYRRLLHRQQA